MPAEFPPRDECGSCFPPLEGRRRGGVCNLIIRNDMDFRTIVDIPKPGFRIEPLERILFVGSCFADNIGQRFAEERFDVVVNPYGVMYNPASIGHTVDRWLENNQKEEGGGVISTAFFTLGTNHVYRLRETGEIVDNCQKKPQKLFQEEELTVDECVDYLSMAVEKLTKHSTDINIVITISPIRYAKYGFHGSQLSKAALLMAADRMCRKYNNVWYFPAYEIVLDELRDYRFYQPDMIHPSSQTVEYLWEKLTENYFSSRALQFLHDWKPIKEALGHRPFQPESDDYKSFIAQTKEREQQLLSCYKRQ